MTDRAARLSVGALLATMVLALAVVEVYDTDAWTHLALGRSIAAERGFPKSEPLNFPDGPAPYYNDEWLFDVILYLAHAAAGLAGVILLKAVGLAATFYVLYRDALLPPDAPSHRALGAVVAGIALAACVPVARYRFVERPDIALMLFLGVTVYALNAYVSTGRRLLWGIPVLYALWANMHPSVVVGLAPFAAFLVGGGAQRAIQRWYGATLPGTPTARQLRGIALTFVASLVATLANPYGPGALLAPFRLGASSWLFADIEELQPLTLIGDPAPFVIAALVGASFLLAAPRVSLTSLALAVPILSLGLSARRFMFLSVIVGAPILARHMRWALARIVPAGAARKLAVALGTVGVLAVTAFTGLALAGVQPLAGPWRPGIGFDTALVPEGALRYLDREGVTGRVLNTPHWGGYIAWRDLPRRAPFVDGRWRRPAAMLEEAILARERPGSLDRLRERLGFEIILLDYPAVELSHGAVVQDVDLGLAHPGWALVYWDDLALVYLRRDGPFRGVVERDEYRQVKPANGVRQLDHRLAKGLASQTLEAELRRNIVETGSLTGRIFLGALYNTLGSHDRAIDVLRSIRERPVAHRELAFAYARRGDLRRAIEQSMELLRFDDDPSVLYNLGLAWSKLGHDGEAIRYLERARARDELFLQAYPALVEAYRRTARPDRAREIEAAYPSVLQRARAREHVGRGEALYFAGAHAPAAAEFAAALQLDPGSAQAMMYLGLSRLELGEGNDALRLEERALAANPRLGGAHWGLARIYQQRGERDRARRHLREYLRLEPHGQWYREARQALRQKP